MRFPDREKHQIFLEPEGVDVDETYVNGYSMSLPRDVQEELVHALPGLEDAIMLRKTVARNQAVWDEIERWRTTRTDVALLLAALQREVPASVQLVELTFSDDLAFDEEKGVVRRLNLTINGLADGFKAKDAVERLTRRLQALPEFTNSIESASVPPGAFAADRSPGAPKSRRVFRIECTFYESPLE